MNSAAICLGKFIIHWNGIVIFFGVLAGFFLSYAIYTAHSGRGSAMWVMFAMSIVSGAVLCRIIHFWCNQEMYRGIAEIFDGNAGGFFLPALPVAVAASSVLACRFGFGASVNAMLDAAAPGLALSMAYIRLSHLFSGVCRSKITLSTLGFHSLPLAVRLTDAAGNTEFRFASFFISFMILFAAAIVLTAVFYFFRQKEMKPHCPRYGHIWRLFILVYYSSELFIDSTRADSTFAYFKFFAGLNRYAAFVSLAQIAAAVAVLLVFLFYFRCSVSANGKKAAHKILAIAFAIGLIGTGISEYLVQRHGNLFFRYYAVMIASIVLIDLAVILLMRTCRQEKPKKDPADVKST